LVKVKPERLAPLAKYTHRADRPPSTLVNCGPLTLRRLSGLFTATRFVFPSTTRSPAVYIPLVTKTSSPATAASTASWMFVAAVVQLV
jgi:hypothetical protein